ncbi:MAG TPA: hypothetical protein O0X97_01230 [Methanocorpusculum sp.]|nr:hypothetical protein [Methanocorpusculum sp.]
MRRISFPLTSLGSDAESVPDAAAVAAWISGVKGNEADLISYETSALLAAQQPYAASPAAGGAFYTPRIEEVFGIRDGVLSNAPELNAGSVINDIELAKKRIKHFSFSLPSPCSLNIADSYYPDEDERQDDLCEAFLRLTREMRDADVAGAVLLSEVPTEIELESFQGKKYLWSVSAGALESVLEFSRDIVLPAEDVGRLAELADSYTVRNVYLKDADSSALMTALETVDRDNLFTAGYRKCDSGDEYWKSLSEVSVPCDEQKQGNNF